MTLLLGNYDPTGKCIALGPNEELLMRHASTSTFRLSRSQTDKLSRLHSLSEVKKIMRVIKY